MCIPAILLILATAPPPPLLSTAAVRRLSPSDATTGATVHLTGVVTALSGWKNSFFLQDASGGISVDRREDSLVRQGDRVQIDGVSGAGLFAPVVVSRRIRVVGRGVLPASLEYSWSELAQGDQDSQWIAVRGIVRSAHIAENWGRPTLFLDIRTLEGGRITGLVGDFPAADDFSRLVDSQIVAEGVAGSNFNDRRQFLGLRLFIPGLDHVHIKEPSPGGPFAAPRRPISQLMQFGSGSRQGHRIRVEGTVTFADADRTFYLQDGNAAIRVRMLLSAKMRPGARVEASGFIGTDPDASDLEDAVVREASGGRPVQAARSAAVDVIRKKDGFTFAPYSGQLLEVEGTLVDKLESAGRQTLILRSRDTSFQAVLASGMPIKATAGTVLRVTGICEVASDTDRTPRAFTLLLRSERDATVVTTPFWTLSRASWFVGVLLLLVVAMIYRAVRIRDAAIPEFAQIDRKLRAAFVRASFQLGLAAAAIGSIVLITRVVLMAPAGAIAAMLLGAAICLDRLRVPGSICCVGALLVGVAGALRFTTFPVAVSLNILLLGLALLLRFARRYEGVAQGFIVTASVNCLLNAMRLLYGWDSFGTYSSIGMARTAVCVFTLLCAAALLARPDAGLTRMLATRASGGMLARRLLPAAILFPTALGWLCWQGQLNGLYGAAFGLILYSSAIIVVFAFPISLTSALLNRMDGVRFAAERDLRESERRLTQLADAMPQIVWTELPSGEPDYHNRRWFEYSGRSAIHSDDLPFHDRVRKRALATGEPYTCELRLKDASGSYRWHRERVVPITGAQGETIRWIGTCTDVDDYKQIQEALHTLNRDLESRVEERTAEAVAANRAKDQFLAAMSHEIRTPMNAILGISDELAETRLDAEQRNYVEICRRAGSALMSLIDDLLDLSKIEAGQLDMESIEFDLEEVLELAVELTAPKARANKLVLALQTEPGLPPCLIGDPARLRQILLNLLGNAVKFTHAGQVVLSVRNAGEPGSGQIEFSVSDTGIGIPADKIDVIFDDFRQADSTTTRNYGGTGLGLGISRRLVERMGGTLTATSEPGQGSTFRFDVKFAVSTTAPESPSPPHDAFLGLKALILGDNSASRLIRRELLSSWGMNCRDFAMPAQAPDNLPVLLLAGGPFDLVLIDCHSDETDGFEVSKRVRAVAPRTPVVMLTSAVQASGRAKRVDCGLAGHAVKPVRKSHMFRLISQALGRQEAEDPRSDGREFPEPANARRGLRILVAEDSCDNQLLIGAYLKDSPHRLTFVENGEAALKAFPGGDFDLVLMDMRMPVMDGLSATRAIRGLERGRRTTPIVALSANASAADIRKSIEAGCQSHVAKPISRNKLLAAIAIYAGTAETTVEEFDLMDEIKVLVPQYLTEREQDLAVIPGLLDAGNFECIRTLGHNMKGSGVAYGLAEVSNIGVEMEKAAVNGDKEAVLQCAHDLRSLLASVCLSC